MPIVRPTGLYVAVYQDSTQDFIYPRNITKFGLSDSISHEFAEKASAQNRIVLAEQDLKGALASSFGKDEILMRKRLELHKTSYLAFIANSDKAMQLQRQTTIYKVPVRDFMPLNNEQWSLNRSLSLAECKAVCRINNASDILKGGVQVFSVTDMKHEAVKNGLVEFLEKKKDEKDFLPTVGELVTRGLLQWENYSRDIKVDKVIAREMGLKLNGRNLKINFKPLF